MASILKVDQLQGATTATTVAIPGGVVQVQFVNSTSGSALSANTASTGHTLLTKTITTKIANSQIYVSAQLSHGVGGTAANMDGHDTTFGTYRGTTLIGGVSGSHTRTTGSAPGGGTWYQTDVPFSPSRDMTYGNAYDVYYKFYQFLDSPSGAAGTAYTYRIAVFNQNTYYHNRGRDAALGGGISTLTLMEIAP